MPLLNAITPAANNHYLYKIKVGNRSYHVDLSLFVPNPELDPRDQEYKVDRVYQQIAVYDDKGNHVEEGDLVTKRIIEASVDDESKETRVKYELTLLGEQISAVAGQFTGKLCRGLEPIQNQNIHAYDTRYLKQTQQHPIKFKAMDVKELNFTIGEFAKSFELNVGKSNNAVTDVETKKAVSYTKLMEIDKTAALSDSIRVSLLTKLRRSGLPKDEAAIIATDIAHMVYQHLKEFKNQDTNETQEQKSDGLGHLTVDVANTLRSGHPQIQQRQITEIIRSITQTLQSQKSPGF